MEVHVEVVKRLPSFLPGRTGKIMRMLNGSGAAEEKKQGRGASNMECEKVRLVESTLNLRSEEEIYGSHFSSFPRSLETSCIANRGKLDGIINRFSSRLVTVRSGRS